MTPVYLDHHATTPLRPAARDAMLDYWRHAAGNPASAHAAGRLARRALDDARERLATRLDAHPDELTLTSGATEANNLAVFGLAGDPPGHLVTTGLEHPCVAEPVRRLEARGFAVTRLPATARGLVEPSAAARPDTRLAAVMLANHETGAVLPVRAVVDALPGVPVHTDAAQAVGKIPVSFRGLGVASLSASAHKFGGPVGVGLLLVRRGTPLRPLLLGGHQQQGRRPGTEPVALAVGAAAALDDAADHMAETRVRLDSLRTRLWERLRTAVPPVVRNGPEPGAVDGLPTALNVSFPGCRADVLLMALDLAGVACSAGSACSSGSLLPSPVLQAMGVPDDVLRSAVRFSLGYTTTEAEIDAAAEAVIACVRRVREPLPNSPAPRGVVIGPK